MRECTTKTCSALQPAQPHCIEFGLRRNPNTDFCGQEQTSYPPPPNDVAVTPTPTDDILTKLADLLTERSTRDRLPLPEPDIFWGDLLQFPNWLKAFETIVKGQTTSPGQHLYYLGRFTAGEAKEAINGFITQNTTLAYKEAKTQLTSRYGNPYLTDDAFLKKYTTGPRSTQTTAMNSGSSQTSLTKPGLQ